MKKKIKKIIFSKTSDNNITWKELKHIQFQDDDIIICEYIEPECTTKYEHDGYFDVEISRMIEETDEQYNQRMIEKVKTDERLKQNRLERYLELKKEFDIDNK